MKSRDTIGVLGLGHVGLPTAVGFAELGWDVIGADDISVKSDQIRQGVAPFYEPGLQALLSSNLSRGKLKIAIDVAEAIEKSDVIFVCVGTPQKEDGSADLSQIDVVGKMIARHATSDKLVVEKSTTPVATAKRLQQTMNRYRDDGISIDVAVNPEFLREGTGLKDFFCPDRIVLGVETLESRDRLVKIYSPLVSRMAKTNNSEIIHSDARFVITDLNTAELIKHASNSFLAMKISFINCVADICDQVGADVVKVAEGMGLDPRIGPSFLNAGIGFGGYCLPKDIKAFAKIGEDLGVDMAIFRAVSIINEQRQQKVISKLKRSLDVLSGKTVAVWGLSFKPETDDVRESPSIFLTQALASECMRVRLHDPAALDSFAEIIPGEIAKIEYCETPEDAAFGADAIIVATDWDHYAQVDLVHIRESMSYPLLIDGRNYLDPDVVANAGFIYEGMGRPSRVIETEKI